MQGTRGQGFAVPPCLRSPNVMYDEDDDGHVTVLWQLPCGPQTGVQILLSRAASIPTALRQVGRKRDKPCAP